MSFLVCFTLSIATYLLFVKQIRGFYPLASQLRPVAYKIKKPPKWTVFKIFARHKKCLRANLLLLELRYACSRIQILVLAKYFGDFIPSPRNFAPLPDKIKKPPKWTVFKILVRAKGLEPSTSTLARLRSSQLSYARIASYILTYLFFKCKHYFYKICNGIKINICRGYTCPIRPVCDGLDRLILCPVYDSMPAKQIPNLDK